MRPALEAHFSREFRRTFGETPHPYLLTRRLERAAALLRNTDRSVADVCLEVGLSSVGSFTTSFKRAFGMTPTAYRRASCRPPAGPLPDLRRERLRASAIPQVSRRQPHRARPSVGQRDPRPQEEHDDTISTVQVWVHDQDEALAFYTESSAWRSATT